MTLPILGISIGDPAGVGPEVTVKALADPDVTKRCRPLVVGDADVLEQAVKFTGTGLAVNRVAQVSQAHFSAGTIDVYDLSNVDIASLELGKTSAMCGQAAFEYVIRLIELAMNGEVDATVTGPINKESINLAGHRYGGHTEIYAEYTGSKRYAMLLVEDELRVIHVSTHVSLRDACDLVRKERVLEAIELIDEACKRLGIEAPR